MKAAFITGVTGQDGSYLAKFLIEKSYDVYGLVRYCSESKHDRINHIDGLKIVRGDLTDSHRLTTIIREITNCKYECIEVYNLAAQSHVKVSFEQPEYTANVDALGTLRLLEAIRMSGAPTHIFKFYQAGTSEMFGKSPAPQNEKTTFWPRSPYGVSKVFSYWITRNYRESYNMFACTGILFNHESERRGAEFVTRKITLGLSNWLKTGKVVQLGNLDAQRDWGHAEDYVEAMWLMLQQAAPEDLVIGTGHTHSVRDFINEALNHIPGEFTWRGEGIHEKLVNEHGATVVEINPDFYRPAEVDLLVADCQRAYEVLNWRPKTTFPLLVKRMIVNDIINLETRGGQGA